MVKILIIEDDVGLRAALTKFLSKFNHEVYGASDGDEGIKLFKEKSPDIVLLDMVLPKSNGINVLESIKEINKNAEVIIMSGYANIKQAVESIKKGAFDYLTKPFDNEELLHLINKACELKRLKTRVEELESYLKGVPLVGKNKVFLEVISKARELSKTDIPILITGETGTGKDLLAKFIHYESPRKDKSFTVINIPSIPKELFESEIFGYRKGAFTGATENYKGLILSSQGGTVFLNEISEIPLHVQSKLLRVIEAKVIRPLGYEREISVDVRFIAATNKDIKKLVETGRFREDLFYRFPAVLNLPPLRERRDDIPLLVYHFIEKFSKIYNKKTKDIEPEALEVLVNFPWPGNIRELENLVENLVLFSKEEKITLRDISSKYLKKEIHEEKEELLPLREMEKNYIKKILELTMGNKREASKILGISRTTLYKKIRDYGL